jgi:YggT family protein
MGDGRREMKISSPISRLSSLGVFMSALGYIIIAFAKVLNLIINVYTLVIIVAVLISWVNADPYNPIVRILRQLTQPVFMLVRRILPRSLRYSRIDISPLIVLIILMLVETIVVGLLYDLARSIS